jgi:two-component system sensor histidine kinase KdpD
MLVGNLLDMSRIESGALRPDRKWNSLSEIVQSVLDRMRALARRHEILIEIPEDFPLVPADFVQIGQVFTNLISNSLKFAPPNTVIRVRAGIRGVADVLVQVSNQGPGVPEEHLAAIFDRFYRMNASDRVTGTGLGLSICKAIIQAHGGNIWAENTAEGFAFNFTLPLTAEGVAPRTPPPDSETR